MFGGRAAKRVFLVLRTTGVLTLAGFVSFSATPPLEGGDVGRAELVSLALSLLAPPFIFETSTRNSWRQASTRGGRPGPWGRSRSPSRWHTAAASLAVPESPREFQLHVVTYAQCNRLHLHGNTPNLIISTITATFSKQITVLNCNLVV